MLLWSGEVTKMNASDIIAAIQNANAAGQPPIQAAAVAVALLALVAPAEAARILCDRSRTLQPQPISSPRRG